MWNVITFYYCRRCFDTSEKRILTWRGISLNWRQVRTAVWWKLCSSPNTWLFLFSIFHQVSLKNVTLWKRNWAMSTLKGFVPCFTEENSCNGHKPPPRNPLPQARCPDSCGAPAISAGLCPGLISLGRCICRKGVSFKPMDDFPFPYSLLSP